MARARRSLASEEDNGTKELIEQKEPVQRKRKADALPSQPDKKKVKVADANRVQRSTPKTKEEQVRTNKTNTTTKKTTTNKSTKSGKTNSKTDDAVKELEVEKVVPRSQPKKDAISIKQKTAEADLMNRLNDLNGENSALRKKQKCAEKAANTSTTSLSKMQEGLNNLHKNQPSLEASLKDVVIAVEKAKQEQAELQGKDNKATEIMRQLEQKERKMDAYIKGKTSNNTDLYNEAIKLAEDNKRLKGNISAILFSTSLGIMSGRI